MKKQMIASITALGIIATGFSTQAGAHELTYTVKSGDTLWGISSRNHLSVQELMQYNNFSSSAIYVGQELSLIEPHSHETATTGTTNYTVKSGDSLYSIAKSYHITVSELKSINNLSSNLINVGQVLKVKSVTTEQAPISSNSKTYTVKSGDTLWSIATTNRLSVSQLKSYNNLTSDTLQIGQTLKLTSDASSTPTPELKPSLDVDELIVEAKKYMGVPYVWGGSTPTGFDCSGFLHHVYNKQGVTIPRTVATIWDATTDVSSPQKGDIVFFSTYAAGPSHAGIYIGDNKFIHAGSSTGVTITDMNNSYWKPRYLGAKSVK